MADRPFRDHDRSRETEHNLSQNCKCVGEHVGDCQGFVNSRNDHKDSVSVIRSQTEKFSGTDCRCRTRTQGERRSRSINEDASFVSKEHLSTIRELLAAKDELQLRNKELLALKSQIQEMVERPRMAFEGHQSARHGPPDAKLFLPIGNGKSLGNGECHSEGSWTSSAIIAWRRTAAVHFAGLTPRQREIMELVVAGRPSKNIAAHLGISQRTVENHRASIMKKTGSKSLPALTRLALFAGGSGAEGRLFLDGLPVLVPQQKARG
jgi:DNA-binding CsgD family transcriptional regulator